MHLIESHAITPERDRTGHTCVGLIDVEISPEIRLYKLRLLRMRDGRHRIYAPYAGRHLAASFSADLAEKLTAMAVEALERGV
ncbi:hypothetical protein [Devosia naphthalenivorans]|uniref:hypothetical protein n=1 Tax=Devosia naphthalenivorans TaxID=2082392 RepID=UPI000D3C12E5|nr:hypothetical protein [Devosia naphthalenivorans]